MGVREGGRGRCVCEREGEGEGGEGGKNEGVTRW